MAPGFDPTSLLTTSRVVETPEGFKVVGPAQHLVPGLDGFIGVLDTIHLAQRIIEVDPFNVEANLALSVDLDGDEAVRYMRNAIAGGEALWGRVIDEVGEGFDWGTVAAFEPYLRAHIYLGEELLEQGERVEAAEVFEHILSLSPGNRSAIRAIEQIDAHYGLMP